MIQSVVKKACPLFRGRHWPENDVMSACITDVRSKKNAIDRPFLGQLRCVGVNRLGQAEGGDIPEWYENPSGQFRVSSVISRETKDILKAGSKQANLTHWGINFTALSLKDGAIARFFLSKKSAPEAGEFWSSCSSSETSNGSCLTFDGGWAGDRDA